jgi:hypothetical protein
MGGCSWSAGGKASRHKGEWRSRAPICWCVTSTVEVRLKYYGKRVFRAVA